MKNLTKKIKNIFLFSYIKNKGIRRICFVAGICLFLWSFSNVINNVSDSSVNKSYKNLKEANLDLYYASKYGSPKWYRKIECMAIYLKKYNIEHTLVYSFTTYEDVTSTHSWCDLYEKECGILKAIKDEPITLKCSSLEDYNHSTTESLCILAIFWIFEFYLPFILVSILKIIFNVFKWIISGFKESKKQLKGKK